MQFVLLLFLSWSVFAHQTSLTPSGSELFWANPNVPVVIRTNTTDMSAADVRSIVLDSMNQWNSTTSAKITSVGSASNEVKFVSNFPYGSAVLGVTELSYNSAGAIQRASILLNDDYNFKNTPGRYYGSQVYLGDVVSHEMGHLLGLSHSEVLDSTMFYSSFSGQSTLSFDDKSGIRQKYDTGYGTITGVVKGGNSVGVLGSHVQAISMKTGLASGAITNENGEFKLGGLDKTDTYYLYVSPVKNPNSLPGYFGNIQNNFCPGKYVGSFYSKCGNEHDGKPQGIQFSNTGSVDVGTISISCSLKSDSDYNVEKVSSTFHPVSVYNYQDENRNEKSFVGWFRNPTTSWSNPDIFTLTYPALMPASNVLKISLVSYPFGTQLQYKVTVKYKGSVIINEQETLKYAVTTNTYNPDFEATVPFTYGVDLNDFEIEVSAKRLPTSILAETFPDSTTFSSSTYLPYLLIASVWENHGGILQFTGMQPNLSDNESCLDAPFTYAVSKTKEAASSTTPSSHDQVAAAAGCGTIEPPSSRGGPGSTLPLLMTGFMLTLIASSIVKSRKKFLS